MVRAGNQSIEKINKRGAKKNGRYKMMDKLYGYHDKTAYANFLPHHTPEVTQYFRDTGKYKPTKLQKLFAIRTVEQERSTGQDRKGFGFLEYWFKSDECQILRVGATMDDTNKLLKSTNDEI